jgi:multicomponent Na+:H+ antiporter subunit F
MIEQVTIAFLVGAIAFSAYLLIRGPSLWERLLAVNLFMAKSVIFMLVYSVMSGQTYLLDLIIAYALISFVGIILICRFLLRGGRTK